MRADWQILPSSFLRRPHAFCYLFVPQYPFLRAQTEIMLSCQLCHCCVLMGLAQVRHLIDELIPSRFNRQLQIHARNAEVLFHARLNELQVGTVFKERPLFLNYRTVDSQ